MLPLSPKCRLRYPYDDEGELGLVGGLGPLGALGGVGGFGALLR